MQPFPGRGRFFLLRHGVTDWNVAQRVMGRLPVAINAAGRRQVAALVPHLVGLGISRVWTSPLPRARETAEIVASGLGELPVEDEPGLTEVHYGAWEGLTFAELRHEAEFAAFLRDPAHTRFPGGGECLLEVRHRVFGAMERIAHAAGGETALVVSHGDPLRLVLGGCLGLDFDHMRRLRIDNAALSAIDLTGDWAEVKLLNMHPDLSSLLVTDRRHGPPRGR